jgi:YfiH family protein
MTDEVLFAENMKSLAGVRHGFFTRAWGNSWFSDGEGRREALRARAKMSLFLGVPPERFVGCHQVHSPTVVTVTNPWPCEKAPQADAIVTGEAAIALGILTADCVPVLLADSEARVIGAAHAGWRGAISGVLENTLEAMETLGAKRKRVQAALGPCIWQRSYEVGPEFPAPFIAEDLENEKYFIPSQKGGHYQFDLPKYVVNKLKALGVSSIESSPADTFSDPELFFSHRYSTLRGEKRAGSLVSAIVLMR